MVQQPPTTKIGQQKEQIDSLIQYIEERLNQLSSEREELQYVINHQSNPIQSNPIQSNPIQSNPIQSNPIQSNPIQSNLIVVLQID